jgi:hypothetical protein
MLQQQQGVLWGSSCTGIEFTHFKLSLNRDIRKKLDGFGNRFPSTWEIEFLAELCHRGLGFLQSLLMGVAYFGDLNLFILHSHGDFLFEGGDSVDRA